MVEHNLQKYGALKKAFLLTALEKLPGDYLEFGVFTGSSFIAATRFYRKMRPYSDSKCVFYGFDSFEGFGTTEATDAHPFFLAQNFKLDGNRVIKNIQKNSKNCESRIIKGFFEDTLTRRPAQEYGITKARVILIDCDTKSSAARAFDFIEPILQEGTIIVMDDFFSYRGNTSRGVAGAFEEFSTTHPQHQFRRLSDFGHGGVSVIVSNINRQIKTSDSTIVKKFEERSSKTESIYNSSIVCDTPWE